MTHSEFEQLVITYGANLSRWPGEFSVSGKAFIAAHPEYAQTLLEGEAVLDGALDWVQAPAPSDLLRKRILMNTTKAPMHENKVEVRKAGYLHWRNAAALMLAAFILGFGGAKFLSQEDDVPVYASEDWQIAANDLGLIETYAWVEGASGDVFEGIIQ